MSTTNTTTQQDRTEYNNKNNNNNNKATTQQQGSGGYLRPVERMQFQGEGQLQPIRRKKNHRGEMPSIVRSEALPLFVCCVVLF